MGLGGKHVCGKSVDLAASNDMSNAASDYCSSN